jgi:hypothetical protein
MSNLLDPPAGKVGYKQPPVETQFKKGQSGNPKGRPKGRKSLSQLIQEELDTKVTVVKDGKRLTLTTAQVMAKRLVRSAASGDHKAIQTLSRFCPEAFENGQIADSHDDAAQWEAVKFFLDTHREGLDDV